MYHRWLRNLYPSPTVAIQFLRKQTGTIIPALRLFISLTIHQLCFSFVYCFYLDGYSPDKQTIPNLHLRDRRFSEIHITRLNESAQIDGILQAMYNTTTRQQILMGALKKIQRMQICGYADLNRGTFPLQLQ